MILAELVRRGRGERILIVTPRHVLEQMQHEMWTRFALPFVRLDSAGIQRVRQKLPATRNPFTYYKRVIISIDTLKSDRYVASLQKQRWDAVVIDESHNLSNTATLNNRLARLLSRNSEALILASATPHNGRAESFAELIRLLDPSAVPPDGDLPAAGDPSAWSSAGTGTAPRWPERSAPTGPSGRSPTTSWSRHCRPRTRSPTSWPTSGCSRRPARAPYSGQNASLFPWTLAKAFLSSPAALRETVDDRLKRLDQTPSSRSGTTRPRTARRVWPTKLCSAALGQVRAPASGTSREIGVGTGSAARAVVFAERIATLDWLQEQLPKDLGLPTRRRRDHARRPGRRRAAAARRGVQAGARAGPGARHRGRRLRGRQPARPVPRARSTTTSRGA